MGKTIRISGGLLADAQALLSEAQAMKGDLAQYIAHLHDLLAKPTDGGPPLPGDAATILRQHIDDLNYDLDWIAQLFIINGEDLIKVAQTVAAVEVQLHQILES